MQESLTFKIPEFDSQISISVGSGLPANQGPEDWTPYDDFCGYLLSRQHIHRDTGI